MAREGWKWLKVVGVRCDECPHLRTGQPAPGSDYVSWCSHPLRGSTARIPEPLDPDPAGFEPAKEDEANENAYVPSWCGRLPERDTPCLLCHGPANGRDDLCAACDRAYGEAQLF